MQFEAGLRFQASSKLLLVVTAVLSAAIFAADTITDLEIAVAVFYVAVVLLSLNFCDARGVVLVSTACMVLTMLSFFLTRTGSPQSGLVNCIISISAIAATTYLALKIESARAAVHEARAQLAHIARVTTLGELTASIAHEVNQPLTAVVTSCSACLRWLSAQPPNLDKARQTLERMLRDANRASEVIGRIRGLAKRTPPEAKSLNVNDVVEETLAVTRSEIEKGGISLQTRLADDLPSVFADRIQLQQVVLNLIINAIEAMDGDHEGARQLWSARRATGWAARSWRSAIPVRDLSLGRSIACSMLSIRPSARVWVLDWRSADRSSKRTVVACGQKRPRPGGQFFSSRFRPKEGQGCDPGTGECTGRAVDGMCHR